MPDIPQKILIIQTAFIGDAILATSLIESWANKFPSSQIDLLVRKGNESLFTDHPLIRRVHIWDKQNNKYTNLLKLISEIRNCKYDAVFNVQRFLATGILTAFSGAKIKVGFDTNPLSFFFTKSIPFNTDKGLHEIERNIELFNPYISQALAPRLYPSNEDDINTSVYKKKKYYCIAPTSVWFTKQWPKENWVKLVDHFKVDYSVYLLGAKGDFNACDEILNTTKNPNIINLAGKLSFLESASLMRDAEMNYVNDSAPMHIASSMNAACTAIYCSTLPSFGFGPLSEISKIIEYKDELSCRPCGLHGKNKCPEGHFDCSKTLDQLIN